MSVHIYPDKWKRRVITDGNLTSPLAVSPIRFSFPYQNQRELKILEQDFVVRSENFSSATLGGQHPVLTDARLVVESSFSKMNGGLVKFTRTFAIIPSQTFVVPTTQNVTFPTIKNNLPLNGGTMEALPDLRESFTKVVPCEKEITFVDMANDSDAINQNDERIAVDSIEVGDFIFKRDDSSLWEITAIDSNKVYFDTELSSDDTQTMTFNIGQRGQDWNVYKPELNFASITIQEKFSPYYDSTFEDSFDIDFLYDNSTLNMTSLKKRVDFVSWNTTPTHEAYVQMIENKTRIQIGDTEIEHFMGHIYKKVETFTPAL